MTTNRPQAPRLAVGDEVLIIGGYYQRSTPDRGRIAKVGRKLYHVTKEGNSWWTGKFSIEDRHEQVEVGAAAVLRTPAEHEAAGRAERTKRWLVEVGGFDVDRLAPYSRIWTPDRVEALADAVAGILGVERDDTPKQVKR